MTICSLMYIAKWRVVLFANAIKSALCTCFGGQQERLLSDNALVHQLNFNFEVIDKCCLHFYTSAL